MQKQTSRIGQRLGNYTLLRLLGEGGFAQVYLGEHIHLGTRAAVKVLHTRLASTDIEPFRTEARTIAHLVHPHIIRVLEFDVEDNIPFLVMDYAEDGTLRQQHPKKTILPIETIVSYVQQIADALQYAHDKKVIHRDIKPVNMLLDRHHQVLLSDFGIAVAVQSTHNQQEAQGVMGTVTYMSPEQLKGRALPASDQYALGIVVYEWLCGERPFRGSFTEICTQHLFASPPSLCEKIPTISPEIERVVLRALAKDPAQRFDNVRDFATTLQQVSETQQGRIALSPQADPPSSETKYNITTQQTYIVQSQHTAPLPAESLESTPSIVSKKDNDTPPTALKAPIEDLPSTRTGNAGPQKTHQPGRLTRRTVTTAGLVGLTGIGIGLTWFTISHTERSSIATSTRVAPTTSTSLPSPTPPSAGATLYTYEGHNDTVDVVVWSPDDSWIASGGGDKTVQIWNPTHGNHLLTYNAHSDAVYTLAWSPDGKQITSGSYDKTVRVWDVADGGRSFTYVYTGHGNFVDEVAWSPDGKRIAVTGVRTMEAWNATNGSQHIVYQQGLGAAKTVTWSPNSRLIASGGGVTVYIWNTADGKQLFAHSGHTDRVDTVAWSPDGKRIASGGKDKTVRIWDATTGGNLVIYSGHHDYVNSVSWSPDSKRIVSGGNDETAQVWDATTGNHLFTYRGHTSDVNTVTWSHDGKRIASGDDGKSVQVWTAP